MQNITHEYRAYQREFKTHKHIYGQMIIPIDGGLTVQTESLESVIDHKKLLFLPPGAEHAYSANAFNEFLVLDIPEQFLIAEDMFNNQGGKLITLDEKWTLVKQLIIRECQNGAHPQSINNLFHYFYQDLVREPIYASLAYIHNYYHQTISLDTLARIEGYTPNYYSEWFKKNMQMSITDYIKSLRIKRTKEMLLNSSYTLMQIAQFVGYSHHASLTRAFKELEGMTPSEFKKLNRKSVK